MASSSAHKRTLTGSTDGKAIQLTATSTPGTTIHTATGSTTAGSYDEIWLWAVNNHTSDVVLTVEFGDTTNNIVVTVPYKSGLIPIVPGFILQNSAVVKAFAGTGSVISIYGYVNAITD